MLPEYFKKTQASFLQMLKAGDIYQSEHPVNFCTRCETAIAFAEVNYVPRTTTLNYFDFDGIEIATTRPETPRSLCCGGGPPCRRALPPV